MKNISHLRSLGCVVVTRRTTWSRLTRSAGGTRQRSRNGCFAYVQLQSFQQNICLVLADIQFLLRGF